MIPEHLARYAHPRASVLELLRSARDYADHHPDLSIEQLRQEMARIHETVNSVIGMLGGERKPRRA